MLIGRHNEQKLLHATLESDKSEFVAIYGRRRIGKTYLVRETFDYRFTFQHTGVQNADKTRQLSEFAESLQRAGMQKVRKLKNWFEAFHALENFLETLPTSKKIIFIDELPWMDTPKSDLVSALEHFWNGWATTRKDIILVVCGSATSWIISKISKNYGGLHNRLTRQIQVKPFTLHECELYAQARELGMNRRQILETYMVLGGIPYYWSLLQRELSWSQNIDNLFFAENAELRNEFDALYSSLFRNPRTYIQIVNILGNKKAGMTRGEIASSLGEDNGGTLSHALADLEQCGFIRAYNSIGKLKKNTIYQLIDSYTLFYFKFIQENKQKDKHFWSRSLTKPIYNAWSGLAFERVCLIHAEQIKKALGIAGVISNIYSWTYKAQNNDETGAQIDMLIDRDDNVINLCEIKFASDKYEIKKGYDEELRHKSNIFQDKTGTRKAVNIVMISTYGLTKNAYSNDIMAQVVMDNLFENA